MLKYLVNDMIDLFAIKTNRFRKQEAPTHLREEVTDVIQDIFKEPCTMKGITFKVEISDNVPDNLHLDVFRIKQIFINLLQNALKFTYEGGIKLSLDYNSNNYYLIGRVSDSGIGISE